MFQLLLDNDKDLVGLVNTSTIDIHFEVTHVSDEFINEPTEYWALDGLSPTFSPPNFPKKKLDLEGFLNVVIIQINGNRFTVNNVIETVTKVMGGRHAGIPFDPTQQQLSKVETFIGNNHSTIRTMKGISQVVLDTLQPLYNEVRARN